ncbi:hypothetical protein ACFC25_14870 [Pseudarthrobacter sp. NPDC055928]|uniref:hypothetical protein n=1 Tax=Pseudarthrobacter sp. NPDC055928 TaxID=3345661 RepID=UPI0035D968A7
MKQKPSALRVVSATAAASVLALSIGLWVVAPANAETSEPTPTCGLICLPGLSEPDPKDPRTPRPKPTSEEPTAPPAPAPPAPPPAEPAPAPVPTMAPEMSELAGQASSEAATSAQSATPSTALPSTESNWNKPITKSTKPTQAAAVSNGDGPGFGDPGLLTILVGVLLVGLGGLAFAWWGRNRASAH